MRLLILALISMISATAFSETSKPVCDAIGTRSEGWYLDGKLIQRMDGTPAFDQCADKAVTCRAIGTRSEGWYTSSKLQLLRWDNCANATDIPVCDAIGTRSEGWYYKGTLMTKIGGTPAYDNCADKVATCGAIGSRSEGWYTSTMPQLLMYANCAN